MISAHIVRIHNGPLRAALYTLVWPFDVAGMVLTTVADGHWRVLLTKRVWALAVAAYLAAIDGAFA